MTSSRPVLAGHRRVVSDPRTLVRAAVGTLVAVVLAASTLGAAAPAGARPQPTDTGSSPWVGLIAPTDAQAQLLQGTRVSRVVVASGWNVIAPQPGVVNTPVLQQLRARIATLGAAGYQVVLDPGLQYPPAWVFDLPGQTRFVNQYGDTWHGPLSEDVPNLVFNPAVRAAAASYLAVLGTALQGVGLVDVRIGGLLSGELRYPVPVYGGHTDGLWMYDPAAQSASPRPGWRPGTGSLADGAAALDFYFGAITSYQVWLMRTIAGTFPGVEQQVLFPSWGIRPGMVQAALAAGMHNTTVGEVNGLIAAGLDWNRQVQAMATTGIRSVAYTTWLDAPVQGASVAQIIPAAYLVRIAAPLGIPVAGENTGRGGKAALQMSLQRARTLGLVGVVYMSGPMLDDGSAGMTASAFGATVAAS